MGAGSSTVSTKASDAGSAVVVDGGTLSTQSTLYASSPKDFEPRVVKAAIQARRLAPFYQGFSDLTDIPPDPPLPSTESSSLSLVDNVPPPVLMSSFPPSRSHTLQSPAVSGPWSMAMLMNMGTAVVGQGHHGTFVGTLRRPQTALSSPSSGTPTADKTLTKKIPLSILYKDAIECPICFLYYPRNINRSRCCDQAICTDCFVQLKRSESTWEPICCPFCVEPDFGVLYEAPASKAFKERYGIKEEDAVSQGKGEPAVAAPSNDTLKRRRTPALSPEVLLSDDIRPGWEKRRDRALAEREAQQRRAAQMQASALLAARQRQMMSPAAIFGDNQIDDQQAMALLSSLLDSMDASSGGPGNGRRRSRDVQRRLQHLRHVGMNLEDLMMMEAMRRSMAESAAVSGGGADNQQHASSPPTTGADADWEPIPAELLQPQADQPSVPLVPSQDDADIHASFATDDSNTPLGILRDRRQRTSLQADAAANEDILTRLHSDVTADMSLEENVPLAHLQHSTAGSPSTMTTPVAHHAEQTEVDTKSLPPLDTSPTTSLSPSTSSA